MSGAGRAGLATLDGDASAEERAFDVVFHHAGGIVFDGEGVESRLAEAHPLYAINAMHAGDGIEVRIG